MLSPLCGWPFAVQQIGNGKMQKQKEIISIALEDLWLTNQINTFEMCASEMPATFFLRSFFF